MDPMDTERTGQNLDLFPKCNSSLPSSLPCREIGKEADMTTTWRALGPLPVTMAWSRHESVLAWGKPCQPQGHEHRVETEGGV